jgi:hypothetical protein
VSDFAVPDDATAAERDAPRYDVDASAAGLVRGALTATPPPEGRVALTPDVRTIESFNFEHDSARPKGTWSEDLAAIVILLDRNRDLELIEVDGFVDPRTDRHPTIALSLRRAQFIVDELVTRGTDPARLRPLGLGHYCRMRHGGAENALSPMCACVTFRIVRSQGAVVPPGWGGCMEAEAHAIKPPPEAVTASQDGGS